MRNAVLSLAIISLFVTNAFSKTQALIRKDGRRHVGLVTKDKTRDGYVVKMQIGVIYVPSSQVARIEDATTPAEEFQSKAAALKPGDVKGRYKLAQWGYKKKLLSEARAALKDVLKADPNHERAKLLIEEIEATMKRTADPAKLMKEYRPRLAALRANDAKGHLALGKWAYDNRLLDKSKEVLQKALRIDPELKEAANLLNKVNTEIGAGESITGTAPAKEGQLLSKADIYKVRLAEFDFETDKRGLRVRFGKDVIKRFVTSMAGRGDFAEKNFARRFRGMRAISQLMYMLDPENEIDPEVIEPLKAGILIESDPVFMKEFRSKVWPVVRLNCAAATCHGAVKGKGRLKLFGGSKPDTQTIYTNFIILSGTASSKGARVIDRTDSGENDSLLLEHLLPREVVNEKYQHPKVDDKLIRSYFKSRNVLTYKNVEAWIKSFYSRGYVNYGLEYKPPLGMKLLISGEGGALSSGL